MIGAIPKIDNVRPLCMDFFKQGFCNRRGPHNQGCLFRHDEIEGKGKIVDETAKAVDEKVQFFAAEASGRLKVFSGKEAAGDVREAASQLVDERQIPIHWVEPEQPKGPLQGSQKPSHPQIILGANEFNNFKNYPQGHRI